MSNVKRMGGRVLVQIVDGNVKATGRTNDGRAISVTVCDGGHNDIQTALAQLAQLIQEKNNATPK